MTVSDTPRQRSATPATPRLVGYCLVSTDEQAHYLDVVWWLAQRHEALRPVALLLEDALGHERLESAQLRPPLRLPAPHPLDHQLQP
jgi:hypothetical protein